MTSPNSVCDNGAKIQAKIIIISMSPNGSHRGNFDYFLNMSNDTDTQKPEMEA